jgi:SAM-dependent methyltransferase
MYGKVRACALSAPLTALSPRLRTGLAPLVEAAAYAEHLQTAPEAFAVDMRTLREAGLTPNDLRWLLRAGYLEHHLETTRPGAARRRFLPGGPVVFTARSCFLLTDAGGAFAAGPDALAVPAATLAVVGAPLRRSAPWLPRTGVLPANGEAPPRTTRSAPLPETRAASDRLVGPARKLFRRAEKAFRADRLDEAAPLYDRLLRADVWPGVQLYRLAMIANRRCEFGAAWRLHRQAVVTDPALAAKITPPDAAHHDVLCGGPYASEDVPCCPVCGGAAQEPVQVVNCLPLAGYHPAFDPVRRWVHCPDCGHGFANPRPSTAARSAALADPPPDQAGHWSYRLLELCADVLRDLWAYRPGGDFLDVGVGGGTLAVLAVDRGYRVCGLDVNPAYAERVRRLDAEFVRGDVATHDFGGRRFEVIALGDVLEHLAEPQPVLARVVALLRPGGTLWLSTPTYEGPRTRALGEWDPTWQAGEQLQFFSLRSLRRLLDAHGLAVRDERLSRRQSGSVEALVTRAARAG